jgi:hypothetical protein
MVPMIVTPTSSDNDSVISPGTATPLSSNRQRPREPLDSDHLLCQCSNDTEKTLMALEHLLEGIKVVKRNLERSLDDNICDTDNNVDRTDSKDFDHISDLSDRLIGILGSNLLGLWNAANVVRERSKLQYDENDLLLQELHHTKRLCIEAHRQAEQTDKVNKRLYSEKQHLMGQVRRLQAERKVLVKECKALRRVAEETRKFDAWRLLEEHVMDSVTIHESVLKSASASDRKRFKQKDETDGDFHEAPTDQKSSREEAPSPTTTLSELTMIVDDETVAPPVAEPSGGNDEQAAYMEAKQTMEENKEAASKKLGFFSMFSMSLHDSALDTPRQQELHKKNQVQKTAEIKDHDKNLGDCISELPTNADEEATMLPNDLALIEDTPKIPAVIDESKNNIQNEANGAFAVIWNSSHFSQDSKISCAASKSCGSPAGSIPLTSSTTHNQNSGSSDEKTDDDDKPTDKNQRSDTASSNMTVGTVFEFDRTCCVVIPGIKKTFVDAKSPGDEDCTGCTESSYSDMLDSDDTLCASGRDMPRSVSFRSLNHQGADSRCPSPLPHPEDSPEGMPLPRLKPSCDPTILRTLAIPSNSNLDGI